MFVYLGKLNWLSYAKNETFALILPKGPVRAGDSVYLFSQWTEDIQGNQKSNWFTTIVIEKVEKTSGGDDKFALKGSWFNFEITTQKSKDDKVTDPARIWTGKIDWREFATNELALFVVPEGFGEGKPVLCVWQWTRASNGELNNLQFRKGSQKLGSGTEGDVVNFSFNSYYEIICNWSKKSEKLAVHMKEHGYGQDIGELNLSALVDHHSHDFNPPEEPPQEPAFEARLPQVQPTLPHIITPLPFPRSLFEVLTHSAAFIDQAGYLAKYAQERFAALDTDFHMISQKLDAVNKEKVNLLDQGLSAASDRELDLKRQLEETIASGQKHDEEDHNVINQLQECLELERKAKADVQQELDLTRVQKAALDVRVQTLQANMQDLLDKLQELQIMYESQLRANEKLDAENKEVAKQNAELRERIKKAETDMRIAVADAIDARNDIREKKDEITSLEEKRAKAEKEAQESIDTATRLNTSLKEAREERDENRARLNKANMAREVLEQLLIHNQIALPTDYSSGEPSSSHNEFSGPQTGGVRSAETGWKEEANYSAKKAVWFQKPYQSTPRVIHGLRQFETISPVGPNLGVETSGYSGDNFTLKLQTRGSVASQMEANWLALPNNRNINFQYGEVDSSELPDRSPTANASFRITFPRPYKTEPRVQCWFTSISQPKGGRSLRCFADQVSSDGCTVTVKTWEGHQFDGARVMWLAWDAEYDGKNVRAEVHYFGTNAPALKKRWENGPFKKPPVVFAALTHIDFPEETSGLRCFSEVVSATEDELEWKAGTWGTEASIKTNTGMVWIAMD
ncbi:hypothetical protein FCOIX_5629 [Fusarium coicis]|nr:hypothetical protein FCOIX_5629 [Fusarium coicis]